MPYGAYSSTGISPPSLYDPTDEEAVTIPVVLEWIPQTDDAWIGAPVHFNVQIADDAGFSSMVQDVHSSITPTNFQYESSPGVWTALPATGLPEADLGKHVRYTPGLTTAQQYSWRVSVEQLLP